MILENQNNIASIEIKVALGCAGIERVYIFIVGADRESMQRFNKAMHEVGRIDKAEMSWGTYSQKALHIISDNGIERKQ